jgi:hypothetical protein
VKKRKPELLPSTVKTSDALYSIWSALEADPKQLAARLRERTASKAEMALAADLIEGKIKPRRPRSSREDRLSIAKRVAWFEKMYPTWQRKKIISIAIEVLKDFAPHRRISARHVYNALDEFDRETIERIKRLPKNENERDIEPNQRLRDDLNKTSRELLIQIIEEFLGRE